MIEKNICIIGIRGDISNKLVSLFVENGWNISFISMDRDEEVASFVKINSKIVHTIAISNKSKVYEALQNADMVLNIGLIPYLKSWKNRDDDLSLTLKLIESIPKKTRIIQFLPDIKEHTWGFNKFKKISSLIKERQGLDTLIYTSVLILRGKSIIQDIYKFITVSHRKINFKKDDKFRLVLEEDILKVVDSIVNKNIFQKVIYVGSLNSFSLEEIQEEILRTIHHDNKIKKISLFGAIFLNLGFKLGLKSFSKGYLKYLLNGRITSVEEGEHTATKEISVRVLVQKYLAGRW